MIHNVTLVVTDVSLVLMNVIVQLQVVLVTECLFQLVIVHLVL